MMKLRRIMSLVLAMTLCISLAVSAYAAMAGIYIYVAGTGSKSGNALVTSTRVKVNPDNAYLKTEVQFSDGLNYTSSDRKISSRGVTSFSYNFPIFQAVDWTPIKAYCAHGVQGGTQSEAGYVQYNLYDLT